MAGFRTAIPDFQLANPLYVGASVFFYAIDEAGQRTTTLATIYAGPIGTQTLANPQTLDGDGKFFRPVYIDQPVIAEIVGPVVGTHSTGIIRPLVTGAWRGDWISGFAYSQNDFLRDGLTGDIYVAIDDFVSGATLADDVAADRLLPILELDVAVQAVIEAEAARDKASEWADKAEDSPVETGPDRYSAFHWSAKAAQSAADAAPVTAIVGDITTVAGISGAVVTTAGIAADISTVAPIAAAISTTAGIETEIQAVAAIAANVTSVVGNATNINAVAANAANINTVAGINADISALAAIDTDIAAVAAEIPAILAAPGFAQDAQDARDDVIERYRGAEPQPLAAGDFIGQLVFDTTAGSMRVWDGTSWVQVASTSIGGIVSQDFVATAGQTVFTVDGGFTKIDVIVNGLTLREGTDYTATDPTITLAQPLSAGAVMQARGYKAMDATDYPTRLEASQTFAPIEHGHAISDVTGLQGALDGKVNRGGDSFTGTVQVQAQAGHGATVMWSGDTGNPGFLEVVRPNGSRAGYFGWASGSHLQVLAAAGWGVDIFTNNSYAARFNASGQFLIGGTGLPILGANSRQAVTYIGGGTEFGISLRQQAGSGGTPLAFINSDNAICGSISTSHTQTSFNTTSDYRLKDEVEDVTGSGAFIDALRPRTFIWKSTGERSTGFIAHEVQEVSPQSVTGEKDGETMQTMQASSSEIMANVIAELQALRARVAQLEAAR